MLTSTDSRLWLAVHLLYPNSSQAFDVYQAIAVQSEDQHDKDYRELAFGRLVQVFEKIPAMSSNLSFFEFEREQVEQWKMLYKGSQKSQLLVFLGVLIFELKINQISPYVKLTSEKALFLFHQMFKKLVKSNSKVRYNDKLNLKKQNDSKISYLYTYENLIEYCLQLLPPEEVKKVEKGLELYPPLQGIQKEYLKIINQIQSLKVLKSHSSAVPLKNKKNQQTEAEVKNENPIAPNFFKNRKTMVATFATFILLSGLFLHLSGIVKSMLFQEHTIVMEKVHIPPPPDIAVESLPKEQQEPIVAKAESDMNGEQSAPVTEEKPEDKPVEQPVAQVEQKAEGGLYRGMVFVKNLDDVNPKIISTVKELGAEKAGEVELGWRKTKELTYYHFTIPEKNLQKLKDFLSEMGKVEIKFEKHPRLVPAGNRRLIIEVKGIK